MFKLFKFFFKAAGGSFVRLHTLENGDEYATFYYRRQSVSATRGRLARLIWGDAPPHPFLAALAVWFAWVSFPDRSPKVVIQIGQNGAVAAWEASLPASQCIWHAHLTLVGK